METSAESLKTEVAHDLLRYFCDIGAHDHFTALLYIAFDLIDPSHAAELSWRKGLSDYHHPYALQVMRDQSTRVSSALTWCSGSNLRVPVGFT
jgi:clathrin heavy chain